MKLLDALKKVNAGAEKLKGWATEAADMKNFILTYQAPANLPPLPAAQDPAWKQLVDCGNRAFHLACAMLDAVHAHMQQLNGSK
jgi:hypothetical protein